jgi:hypothetical protein
LQSGAQRNAAGVARTALSKASIMHSEQTPAADVPGSSIDLANPKLYANRELSWLEFNQRVLDQALHHDHPLLERIKFLAIVGRTSTSSTWCGWRRS